MQGSSENRIQELEQGFRFGDWRASPHANKLTRRSGNGAAPESRRVSPKAMQVLVQLATRPGKFLSKNELLSTVWSGRVVTEDVLTGAIRVLRRAMNDKPAEPKVIETRKGSGYRLIVDVDANGKPSTQNAARQAWRWAIAASLFAGVAAVLTVYAPVAGDDRRGDSSDVAIDALVSQVDTTGDGVPADDAEALLHARYLLAQGDVESLQAASAAFATLKQRYPELPDAHLGWASSQLALFKRFRADRDDLDDAYAAAKRALALNPLLNKAYRDMGQIVLFRDWDFEQAEAHYLRALEMDSSDTVAIRRYAWLLAAMHRFDEAKKQIENGRRLEPLYYASADGALLLLAAGEAEKAVAELEQLSYEVPDSSQVLDTLAIAYWAVGRYEESVQALIASRRAMGKRGDDAEDLAMVYARNGRDGVYRYLLATNAYRGPVRQAALHAQIGNFESALDLLDRAYAEHDPGLLFLAAQPEFLPIRENERYQDLIARIQQ